MMRATPTIRAIRLIWMNVDLMPRKQQHHPSRLSTKQTINGNPMEILFRDYRALVDYVRTGKRISLI